MKTFTQKTIGVLIGSLLILLSYSTRLQAQGGEALNLDGGNDYITTSSVAFGNNWSVEGWIKPSNTNGIYWNAVFGQIFYNNNQGFVVGVFANTVFLDGPLGLHIETGVTANVWAHIAVTCDNGLFAFYKDGLLIGTKFISGYASATTNFMIGARTQNGGTGLMDAFQGNFDEIRIWNTTRTQCELLSYMHCEIPTTTTGLISNYHFNQGGANSANAGVNTLLDVSGYSHNGAMSNFALTGTTSNWTAPGAVPMGSVTPFSPLPEINVKGNNTTILNGDLSPSLSDYTDFGAVGTRTFVIESLGTHTLNLGAPFFMYGDSGDFKLSVPPSTVVAASTGTTSFVVSFAPTSLGVKTTTVYIYNSDCDEPVYQFAITATATAAGVLNFDGVNDFVETNANLTELGQGDFTIEAWIKTTSVSQGILSCANANTVWETGEKSLYIDAVGRPVFVGFGNAYIPGNVAVNDGNWHHLAVVWDYNTGTSGTGNFYIDGINRTGSVSYNALNNNIGTFKIGQQNYNYYTPEGPNNFKGSIDEVRVWNRALCLPEITNNMNCELPNPTTQVGLKGYYRFNSGIAFGANTGITVATDNSSFGNNGTLTNFALTGETSNWNPQGPITTGVSCSVYLDPEINLMGNGTTILDGDISPSTADNTDFASVCVNGSATRTFSVQNLGTAPLTISSIVLTGASSYSVGALSPASPIAAGGSATFAVTFMPTSSGVQTSTLTITNNDCSEASYDVVLTGTGNALPVLAVNSGVLCVGSTFTMSPSGAVTYTYSSGTNTVSPAVGTNTFSVMGTDANNCISAAPAIASVTVVALPVLAVNSGSICAGSTFTMTPSGAVTYTYSSGTNTVSPAVGTNTFSVIGTDANNCMAATPAIASVTVAALPVLAVNSGSMCVGNTFTMTPSGALTYTYSSGTNTVSPAVGTTSFAVSGTGANGCVSTVNAIASITVAALPVLSVNSGLICVGSTFTMSPSGAVTYTYSSGTNTVSPALGTSTFAVSGTDANGCVSNVDAIATVTVAALPVLAVNSGSICAGATFTMSPSGAVTYTYSSGTNTVSPAVGTTTFAVSGTDANGCVSNVDAIASVTVAALPVLAVNSGSICAGNTFTMTPSGAITYTYSSGTNTVSPAVGTTTFAVSGTDANGCVSSVDAIASITVAARPVLAVNSGSICVGSTFTMSPSGALTYTYSSGTNTVSPAVGTNTFAVSGTDANGCVSSIDAISSVTVAALPVLAVNSGSICAGATFTMSPSGAATYTYSSGTNTVNPAVGTYTFSVMGTDANNCMSAAPAIASVTVAALPVLAVNSGSICVGNTFTMAPSGAITYTYSSGTNTVSPAVGTTTFAVSGTDANGCVSSVDAIASVTVAALPVLAVNSGSICVGATFTMNPTGAITYTYSSGTNTVSPAVGTSTFAVSGTDANGCVSNVDAIASVTVAALPVLAVNSGSICAGATFTMIPSGAVTYTFSSGGNTVSPAIGTNTFSVMGTDANNCISGTPAIATVTVNSIPTIAVNSGSICVGATFTMNASGASTYTYSCGSNMISPAVGTNTFTVMGTSAQGCTSSTPATATVVVNALPVITVNSGSICLGSVFVMHPSGALTYTYSSGSNAVSPSATSSYSVTGTDLYGCQSASAAVATVTVNLPPSLSVNSGSMCAGSTFTMIPSGALTYTYSSGSNTVSPSSSTSYSVTGTDVNGCVSSTAAVSTVTVNTVPVINVNSGVICAGQSFTMVPSGATTYTYSNGSNVVNPLVGISTFSVSGTNAAGCISTTQAVSSVTVNALPVIAVNSGAICRGSVFVFSPSGAITYTYTGGSNTVNPTITSTYSVTGTNAQGCISATPAVATVTVYTLPTVSVNSGSICAGSTFTMAPSGAVTYSYTSGSSVVSPATTASYSVTGTDAHGCVSATAAISTVTVNALPVISVNSGSMCAGASFTLNPSGAASYTISGGSQVVSPASTTSYSVMGTSVSGCLSASPIIATVTVNALPTISASNGSICVGQTFTLNPIGAASYTYSSGTNTVTPTSTSTYTIAGTSAAGCSTAAPITVTVTVNALPVISVNGGSICAGSSFTMNPSGAVTYTYSSGSNVVTPFVTSTYSVTGTDSHGCHSASPAMATVTVNSLPTLTINTDHFMLCPGQTAILTVSGASAYAWQLNGSSSNTLAVTPSVTTTYYVTGTSANGCSITSSFVQAAGPCTGIDELSASGSVLSVYPNPTNGELNVDLTEPMTIIVSDLLGNIVMEGNLEGGHHLISLEQQRSGMYILVAIASGHRETVRIVKQ